MKRALGAAVRFAALLVVCGIALQLTFAARIALMRTVDPQSTTFQRSQAWRILTQTHSLPWSQSWRPYEAISDHLKRAVIASEDANFSDHSGVEWEAIEKAWERNQQAEARAQKVNEQMEQRLERERARGRTPSPAAVAHSAQPRIVGGSTITQQLAKNLFLSGERNMLRKGQEIVITYMLEALLGKQRILEIYLNSVEWGEGVFGAQAAAQHYFRISADRLSAHQAARLAVMLPAPRRFEKRPGSPYVIGRASVIVARMGAVDIP
ncbi:MAG TPA: transglycosylase domain-containing protein [Burkholderiaceae bacterium]|jgi:monofunctional biosynthetic peptidoglycan transglycosylase|nr:transglycosylase domain-containing protein [Burkholderiaceae bacterium]